MAPGAQCPTLGAGGTDMPWQIVPVEYSRASISCAWPACTNQISLSAIPADYDAEINKLNKPSALDQAVAKVKNLGETPLILKGFPQEYDLALLLESLAALQAAIHKGPTLAKIVLACTTWVDFLSLSDGSLDHVRELAESDADRAEFTDMVRIAGDIASNIADGAIGQQKRNLLTVAQYALAWLAELIEKEEA